MPTIYVSSTTDNGYAIGSDSYTYAQAQNKATPFLTLDKAASSWLTGDSIVINGNTANPVVYVAATFFNLARGGGSITCEVPYGAVLQPATGQARVCNFGIPAAQTLTIGALVIDGINSATNCIDTGASASTWIFNGTKFINGASGLAKGNAPAGIYYFNNCILGGAPASFGINHSALASGGAVYIDGLSGSITGVSASIGGAVYCNATATGSTVLVRNVTVNQTNTTTANASLLTFYNISNLLVEGPGIGNGPEAIIQGATTGAPALVRIGASSSIAVNDPVIRKFKGANLSGNGYLIYIGNDGSNGAASDYMITDPVVTKCDLRGNPASSTMHGVIVGCQIGGLVADCRIRNVFISVVNKLGHTNKFTALDNDVSLGTEGNASHMYSKGNSVGSRFLCNQIHLDSGFMNNALQASWDSGSSTVDSGARFLGNNIYASTTASKLVVVGTSGNASDTSSAAFALNNYFLSNVSGTPFVVGSATTYATLPLWGAAQEVNYRALSPTVVDPQFYRYTYRDIVATKIASVAPQLLPMLV